MHNKQLIKNILKIEFAYDLEQHEDKGESKIEDVATKIVKASMPDAEKTYILQKDLPKCPKGRKFVPNIDGDYFLSMTDEEYIDGKLKRYNFTKNEVELNPDWFLLITD